MWFNVFVFFIMLFMHTIADFVLQIPCLSDLKQIKKWNEFTKDMFDEDVEETMYRNDYVAALLTHSFMWAFMTFVPLLLIGQNYWLLILIIVVNSIIHLLIAIPIKTHPLYIYTPKSHFSLCFFEKISPKQNIFRR